MKNWTKADLIRAVLEERESKGRILADRNAHLEKRQLAERELQQLRQKLSDANERANKEQGRADSAVAALARAHDALVIAVRR